MNAVRSQDGVAVSETPEELNVRWRELCSSYLPLSPPDSFWRYSRASTARDPGQGWKLHVSATLLTAAGVLEKIGPFLSGCGTMFKAPGSLEALGRLNSGLYYGFCQVGKCFTVYPRSDEEALLLADRLHELTAGMSAPLVAFDRRLLPGSCVYYRYGAFEPLEIENPDGTRTPALRDPEGNLVPDVRDSAAATHAWASDPFARRRKLRALAEAVESPLKTTYRVYCALTQRGKGGVYEAVDLSVSPPRLCVLKEGRRGGEVCWDGRDGFWRVRHEGIVIGSLREAGVEVPRVFSSFEAEGNYYLVTELIEGETLHAFLRRRGKRLAVARALRLSRRLAEILSRIHSAGWAWRDCKPSNLMMTPEGDLRPFDFEGACKLADPDPVPWGTEGFTPKGDEAAGAAPPCERDDLYGLGAIIYLMLTGKVPDPAAPVPLEQSRRNVPTRAARLVDELLRGEGRDRLTASLVAERLDNLLPRSAHGGARKIRTQARAA
jgi:hypothetical protein